MPVVDLWDGTARPGQPWAADTRAVLMSLTKGLAALCVQILVDRGQVDLDAPVSVYWPQFAAAGKENGAGPACAHPHGGGAVLPW